MRQVTRIIFARGLILPTGQCVQEVYGAVHKLTVDQARRFFTIDGHEYNYDLASRVDWSGPEHSCPECGQEFDDAQGLGGHRAKKHAAQKGVKAT